MPPSNKKGAAPFGDSALPIDLLASAIEGNATDPRTDVQATVASLVLILAMRGFAGALTG